MTHVKGSFNPQGGRDPQAELASQGRDSENQCVVTPSPFVRKKDTERMKRQTDVKTAVMVENVAAHKMESWTHARSLERDCNVTHYPEGIKEVAKTAGTVWIKYKKFKTAKWNVIESNVFSEYDLWLGDWIFSLHIKEPCGKEKQLRQPCKARNC